MKQTKRLKRSLGMLLVLLAMFVPQGLRAQTIITAGNCATYGLTEDYVGYYAINSVDDLYKWAAIINKAYKDAGGDWNCKKAALKGKYSAVLCKDIVVNKNLLQRNDDGTPKVDSEFLVGKVTLNNTKPRKWETIKLFCGTLDGNGHSISGLYGYFDLSSYIAGYNIDGFYTFFSNISNGTIKNITVKDSYFAVNNVREGKIMPGFHVGGFAGAITNSNVINATFEGVVSTRDGDAGGICGNGDDSNFVKCVAKGYCKGEAHSYNSPNNDRNSAGGIVGVSNRCKITACINEATIFGRDLAAAGGMSGESKLDVFSGCLNLGRVQALLGGNITGRNYKTSYKACFHLKDHAYSSAYSYRKYCGIDSSYEGQSNATNEEAMSSGALAYLLNGKQTDDDVIWRQELGTDNFPHFDEGPIVYYGTEYLCDGETVSSQYYTNDADRETVVHNEHDWDHATEYSENGIALCVRCKKEYHLALTTHFYCQEPVKAADGFYEISNLGQLLYLYLYGIGYNVNYRLMTDITVNENVLKADGSLNGDGSNLYVTTPLVSRSGRAFQGTFDGNGHTISGLYFNDPTVNGVGFIKKLDYNGHIKNLGIKDSYFCGHYNVGAIVGEMIWTLTGFDQYDVNKYCSDVTNCWSEATVKGDVFVGGIVGTYSKPDDVNVAAQLNLYEGQGVYFMRVEGCYNVGKVEGDGIGGFLVPHIKTQNNYSLTGAASECEYGTVATAAQFASGEVCYGLNGGQTSDDVVWRQGIGTDLRPVIDAESPVVFYGANVNCAGNAIADNVYANHGFGASAHTAVHHPAVAATCTTDGNSEYYECTTCGKVFRDEACTREYNANGWVRLHQHMGLSRYFARETETCKQTGCIEHYKCSACGKYFADDRCRTELSAEDIFFHGPHDMLFFEKKAAGCEHSGLSRDVYQCSLCDKYFEDEEATTELAAGDVVTPATGHGTIEHHDAVAATCTESGTEEYWTCSHEEGIYYADAGCTTVLQTLRTHALGHDIDHYDNGFATCSRCHTEQMEAPLYYIAENICYIRNAGQLYWFAGAINNGTYKDIPGYGETDLHPSILIANDISINENVINADGTLNTAGVAEFRNWTPIGTEEEPYTGAIVTAGADSHSNFTRYYINGVYCNQPESNYVGLIGNYAGVKSEFYSADAISEIAIVGSYFNGAQYVGALAGKNAAEDAVRTVMVERTIVKGNDYVGGVFGQNTGVLTAGFAAATIESDGTHKGAVAGASAADVISNFYCLDEDTYATQKTAEEFASGEVAAAIGFCQYLGEDAMPCFVHNMAIVHAVHNKRCDGVTEYIAYTNSNNEEDWVGSTDKHNYVDGECTVCHTHSGVELIPEGETEGTVYATLDAAFEYVTDGCTLKLTGDVTMDNEIDMDSWNRKNITIDLNGYSIDGSYEKCEDYWDDEANDWLLVPGGEYNDYRRLSVSGSTTIKNGTIKANIEEVSDDNLLTIDNATVIGSRLGWVSAPGVDIKNNSTLSLNSELGGGQFSFEDCKLDATSKVVLTGINQIGMYGNVPGGYREIIHRIAVPDGYVLKKNDGGDKNLRFYLADDPECSANMKGVTITINGSDPLSECSYSGLEMVQMHNEDYSSYWTDYYPTCPLCLGVTSEGAIVYDKDKASHFCDHFVLDDSKDYTIGINFKASSATYTRHNIKNQWGTIILPFAVDGNGKDYDLYTLSSVSGDEITLAKVDGTLAANTPALIRLGGGLAGNYDLTINTGETQVSYCWVLEDVAPTPVDGLALTGSYSVTDITYKNGYIISNNKFWSIQDVKGDIDVYCAPFRAYLAGTLSNGVKQLNIGISEDADAIEAITAITEGDAEYYDLNGRKLNSLQTGVNIVKYSNGKIRKVIVK